MSRVPQLAFIGSAARAWLLATLLCGGGLLPCAFAAQEESSSATSTTEGEALSVPEAASPEPSFESPREALRVFVDGMRALEIDRSEERVPAVLAVFDFRTIPVAERLSRAKLLFELLNRAENFSLERIPGGTAEPLRSLPRYASFQAAGDEEQSLTLVFRWIDTGWRIDGDTVRRLPEMYHEWQGLPLAEDFLEGLPWAERMRFSLRQKLSEGWTERAFLLENWQWFGLALLVFLAVLFDAFVVFLVRRLWRRLARGIEQTTDADSLASFSRPLGIFAMAWLFRSLLPTVGIEPAFHRVLDLAASTVLTFAGVWAAYRLVDLVCESLTARAEGTSTRFDDVLVPLLRRTLKILVSIIGLGFIASRLSEQVWSVLAGLSIGSLAIGFAAKDSIENLFGTFTVLMDKPFQLGDWIVVGDLEGTVEEVGFRSTRIRTFYNSLITVPNSRFISADVDNMGERRFRRIKTTLSLTYSTPPDRIEAFCQGVRRLIELRPLFRRTGNHVWLNGLSASSLDVLLYTFVEVPDWEAELREKHEFFADILALAQKLDVSFAFPTQTLHVEQSPEGSPPEPFDSFAGATTFGREAAEGVRQTHGPS